MKLDVTGRILGSALVIIGYFIVLNVSVTAGVIINLVGDTISMPFFIRTKAWDVVAMISFMTFVSVSKLLSLL